MSNPIPEITHEITYDHFSSALYNRDFKGKGHLTIRPDGPTYIFAGKPRGWFAGKAHEVVLRPDDIANVVVEGRVVLFKTKLGRSGKQKQPFVFHLKDAAEARAVVELLPTTTDIEFNESKDFAERLAAIAGPHSPWQSPTNIIIGLNLCVYVVMGLLGAGWFEAADIMPYILYGANNGAATTDGEWWRLLTSMFMHYGLVHLLFNMWALLQAGRLVEKLLGRVPFALMYLSSGLVGGFASILWHGDQTWSAGASGAVFGVYGAIIGFMLRQRQALPASIYRSLMKSTLGFAAYNILYGMARAGIDNSAHLGGLLGGIALAWLLALPLDREVRQQKTKHRLRLGLLALIILCTIGVLVTPRYDYNIREVLAWEDANRDFVPREQALLEKNQSYLAGLGGDTDAAAYAAWVESELIPFYQAWQEKLTTLPLRRSEQIRIIREKLTAIFALRLESYDHLLIGLRTENQEAIDLFLAKDTRVNEELTALENAAAP